MQIGDYFVDDVRISICLKLSKRMLAVRLPYHHQQAEEGDQSLTVVLLNHLVHDIPHLSVSFFWQDYRLLQPVEPKGQRSHLVKRIGELREQNGRKGDCDVLYQGILAVRRHVELPLMRHFRHDERDLARLKPFRAVADSSKALSPNDVREFPTALLMQTYLVFWREDDVVEGELFHCGYKDKTIILYNQTNMKQRISLPLQP